MSAKRIAIVLKPSGRGVSHDVEILKSKLPRNFQVDVLLIPNKSRPDYFCYGFLNVLQPFFYKVHVLLKYLIIRFKRKKFGLAIYIEAARPAMMFLGEKNVLIPNQEWFSPSLKSILPFFDEVWCKTNYAEKIFRSLGSRCRFIGFSSIIDPALRSVEKNTEYFLHRSGNSALRGTASLIELWRRHPEWPLLKILASKSQQQDLGDTKNIIYAGHINSDQEFQYLMATSAFHIQPTQTEGYGLTISEALGYGCIVIATDAPPMNELVTIDRGELIPVEGAGRFRLSELFYISIDGLEKLITSLLSSSESFNVQKSRSAIEWFDKNDFQFELNIKKALTELFDSNA
jgi:glycosyltransferase involved in cell wall biosynthesis